MPEISLPTKIDITAGEKPNQAIISLQPFFPGYGITVGNALRRVLLSSLGGAAITAVKIKGANHEFSSLENIKEDMVEIILNLKKVAVKVHGDEPVRFGLKVKGEQIVKAGDFETGSNSEISNPDQEIATITDKDSEFEMEVIADKGHGFVTTESREGEDLEVGMIAIDAIYSPIVNVGIKTENVRVGKMTNYENLILTMETDGSIDAQTALNDASQILIDQFSFVLQSTEGTSKSPKKAKKSSKPKEEDEPKEEKEEKEEVAQVEEEAKDESETEK